AKCRDGVLQSCRAALARADRTERSAEVHLAHGPAQRPTLARMLFQGFAAGRNRLLESLDAVLPITKPSQHVGKVVLDTRPAEGSVLTSQPNDVLSKRLPRLFDPPHPPTPPATY